MLTCIREAVCVYVNRGKGDGGEGGRKLGVGGNGGKGGSVVVQVLHIYLT